MNHPGLVCCVQQTTGVPLVVMVKPDTFLIQEIKTLPAKAKVSTPCILAFQIHFPVSLLLLLLPLFLYCCCFFLAMMSYSKVVLVIATNTALESSVLIHRLTFPKPTRVFKVFSTSVHSSFSLQSHWLSCSIVASAVGLWHLCNKFVPWGNSSLGFSFAVVWFLSDPGHGGHPSYGLQRAAEDHDDPSVWGRQPENLHGKCGEYFLLAPALPPA